MQTLAIYDVVATDLITAVSIGTVAPGSSDDTALRVYNQSDLYVADAVQVTLGGPNAGQIYLSDDGIVFTTTVSLGDIPPGGYSAVFVLRRVTHHITADQSYSATLIATPAGWSDPGDSGTSPIEPLDTSDD